MVQTNSSPDVIREVYTVGPFGSEESWWHMVSPGVKKEKDIVRWRSELTLDYQELTQFQLVDILNLRLHQWVRNPILKIWSCLISVKSLSKDVYKQREMLVSYLRVTGDLYFLPRWFGSILVPFSSTYRQLFSTKVTSFLTVHGEFPSLLLRTLYKFWTSEFFSELPPPVSV